MNGDDNLAWTTPGAKREIGALNGEDARVQYGYKLSLQHAQGEQFRRQGLGTQVQQRGMGALGIGLRDTPNQRGQMDAQGGQYGPHNGGHAGLFGENNGRQGGGLYGRL